MAAPIYKDTSRIGLVSTLANLFKLNSLFKDPISKHNRILRCWGLGLQHSISGHTNQITPLCALWHPSKKSMSSHAKCMHSIPTGLTAPPSSNSKPKTSSKHPLTQEWVRDELWFILRQRSLPAVNLEPGQEWVLEKAQHRRSLSESRSSEKRKKLPIPG